MLANLSISMFSPRKTDKKVTKEVIDQNSAGEKAGKFVKALLPEEALESLKKLQSEARQYHYENSLAWTDEGARILPSTHYMEYVDKMRGFSRRFEDEVDKFMASYDDFVERARIQLNRMFDAGDYPDWLGQRVFICSDFLPFPDGSDFRLDIADEELAHLRQQTDQRVQEASDAARRDLWLRLLTPLKAMAERLNLPESADGKGPVFRDTLVGNISDIVKLIPALNVTGDADLEKIRCLVQDQLTKHTPETLRKSRSARRETAAAANAILATMSGYLPEDAAPSMPALEVVAEPEPLPVALLNGTTPSTAHLPAVSDEQAESFWADGGVMDTALKSIPGDDVSVLEVVAACAAVMPPAIRSQWDPSGVPIPKPAAVPTPAAPALPAWKARLKRSTAQLL